MCPSTRVPPSRPSPGQQGPARPTWRVRVAGGRVSLLPPQPPGDLPPVHHAPSPHASHGGCRCCPRKSPPRPRGQDCQPGLVTPQTWNPSAPLPGQLWTPIWTGPPRPRALSTREERKGWGAAETRPREVEPGCPGKSTEPPALLIFHELWLPASPTTESKLQAFHLLCSAGATGVTQLQDVLLAPPVAGGCGHAGGHGPPGLAEPRPSPACCPACLSLGASPGARAVTGTACHDGPANTAREPGEGRQGVHSVCTRSQPFTCSFGRTPGREAWAHRGVPAARCPGRRKVCGTGQAWSRGPEASESPGLRRSLGYPLRFGHEPRGLDRPNPLPVPGQSRALLPSVRHGVSSSQAGEDGGPGRAAGGPCPQARPQGLSERSRQPRPYTHGN